MYRNEDEEGIFKLIIIKEVIMREETKRLNELKASIKKTKPMSKISLDEFIDIYSEIHGGMSVVKKSIESGRKKFHAEFWGTCGNHGSEFKVKGQNVDRTTFLCKQCKDDFYTNHKIERMLKRIENEPLISIVSIEKKGLRSRINLKCLKHDKEFSFLLQQVARYEKDGANIGCVSCLLERAVRTRYKDMRNNKNIIATKSPDMVQYLKNKDDAFNYTIGSNKIIDFKCPHCGYEKQMSPNQFVRNGKFSCNSCGDIRSSGVKIFLNMLLQLKNIDFKAEYLISGYLYRYDFYIKNTNTIVEIHGRQHYNDTESFGWIPLDKTIKNDIVKKEIALKNGFNYIEIDCRKSNFDFIKNSIIQSIGDFFGHKQN